jgi:hypothetical protein
MALIAGGKAVRDRSGNTVQSGSSSRKTRSSSSRPQTKRRPSGNGNARRAPTAREIQEMREAGQNRDRYITVNADHAPTPTTIEAVDRPFTGNSNDFEQQVREHGLPPKSGLIAAATTLAPVEDASIPVQDNPIPVEDRSTHLIDLSRYQGKLGYGSDYEAYQAYQQMTPEERGIFQRHEDPTLAHKLSGGLANIVMPGISLIGKALWSRNKTLKDKIKYAKTTAATIARNEAKGHTRSRPSASTATSTATASGFEYAGLDHYRNLFNNFKF